MQKKKKGNAENRVALGGEWLDIRCGCTLTTAAALI
jgi:hypothetical protein